MRIAQVSLATESTPGQGYGAIGRIVGALTDELVRTGQDVTLFATGDSTAGARLEPVVAKPMLQHTPESLARTRARLAQLSDRFDIVHNHDPNLARLLDDLEGPAVITTCHVTGDEYWHGIRHQSLVALSSDQRTRIPSAATVITAGVPATRAPLVPLAKRLGYALIMGRVTAAKGVLEALELASACGLSAVIAGPVFAQDRGYYHEHLTPRIDGRRAIYWGEAAADEREQLLSHAAALLFLTQLDEPLGLVMLEAMDRGTPVVATRRGAAGEIVDDGLTGIVLQPSISPRELRSRLAQIEPEVCRARADRLFRPPLMAERYVRLYERLRPAAVGDSRGRPVVIDRPIETRGRARRGCAIILRGEPSRGMRALAAALVDALPSAQVVDIHAPTGDCTVISQTLSLLTDRHPVLLVDPDTSRACGSNLADTVRAAGFAHADYTCYSIANLGDRRTHAPYEQLRGTSIELFASRGVQALAASIASRAHLFDQLFPT